MMEGEERGFLLQRLAEVRRGFDGITVPVHLELASMANPRCVEDILDQVSWVTRKHKPSNEKINNLGF